MPVFLDAEPILPREFSINIPTMRLDGLNDLQSDMEPRLSDQDEDSLLKVKPLVFIVGVRLTLLTLANYGKFCRLDH